MKKQEFNVPANSRVTNRAMLASHLRATLMSLPNKSCAGTNAAKCE